MLSLITVMPHLLEWGGIRTLLALHVPV
jgi:hypothetical protein